MYRVVYWSDERDDWEWSRLFPNRKMAQAEMLRVQELTPPDEIYDAYIEFDFVVFAHTLYWNLGPIDEWNCSDASGLGITISQLAHERWKEVWKWEATGAFMHSCGTGQEPSRMRAVISALRCLERDGRELLRLPHEIVRRG